MRDRAGKKRFALGTECCSGVTLAAVGKPYKLLGWNTVCEYLLALKITLFELEHFSDCA
jgi:hypothetical protein